MGGDKILQQYPLANLFLPLKTIFGKVLFLVRVPCLYSKVISQNNSNQFKDFKARITVVWADFWSFPHFFFYNFYTTFCQIVFNTTQHYTIVVVEVANVFLSSEAYARLKALKKQKQSFSDVVMEYVPQEIDLKEFLGSCRGMDAKRVFAEIKRDRER